MSKIESICKVVDDQHCMGCDRLRDYYTAREVRNANLKHDLMDRYRAIQRALKNHNVRVSITPDGDHIHLMAYATRAEVTL